MVNRFEENNQVDDVIRDTMLRATYTNTNSNDPHVYTIPRTVFRHRYEILVLAIIILLSTFVYLTVIMAVSLGMFSVVFLSALLIPLSIYVLRGVQWGLAKSSMVPMTPDQFPDGWMMVEAAARDFGIPVPEAYVVSGSGAVNAFAAGHEHRRYIVVYSDLFEVGGKARNPEALEFVISHEMGHIAAGHTSYWRIVATSFATLIPILGNMLSRSQEYTADSYAYSRVRFGANSTIGILAAGKYLGPSVDSYSYGLTATNSSVWTIAANLLATHPVLSWRAHALLCSSSGPKKGRLVLPPKKI